MSSKISALPAAANVGTLDEFVIVQAGVNRKCNRGQVLQAAPADTIELIGGGGFSSFSLDATDNGRLAVPTGKFFLIEVGVTDILDVNTSGDVILTAVPGQQLNVQVSGLSLVFDPGTPAIRLQCGIGGLIQIEYHAGTPGDWAGAPSAIWQALDRIAAVVRTLNGAPIP